MDESKKSSGKKKMKGNEEKLDELQNSSKTLALKAPKIPTSIHRLQQRATNLNLPPDNWLRSTPFENLDGFNTKTYLEDRFSSFRMGFEYLHVHQNVNVITAANNIKRLLTLALANDSGLSMVVHPVGQSLLIDNFDIHKWLLDPSQSKPKWKWLRNFFFDKVLQGELHKAIVRKSHTNDALVERNLMSKFLYYSLPHDYSTQNNTLVYREHSSPAKTDEVTTHHDHQGPPSLPEPEEVLGPSHGPNLHNKDFGELRGHARNLLWNIQDIRMLIGSDMPIFGDSSHPTVSLRLHNVNKPINILTGWTI